ncbi:hypothetical protein H6G97_05420 [Nostoc flagelliforme FACHB-838]|uniref:Transposase n=1 Tax=Nostoc flagelliforme FACHB-838 TaxID=2692904 RepID=A0ABR8DHM5_9NOSO|nr:hypothetical protein [Nostoc flagelliforme FACHB-838]
MYLHRSLLGERFRERFSRYREKSDALYRTKVSEARDMKLRSLYVPINSDAIAIAT